MKRKTLNLLASLAFLIAVAAGYYLIWQSAKSGAGTTSTVSETVYVPVNVSNIKTQAQQLIQSRENNAGIPISVPADDIGKPDPFTNPQ